MTGCIGPSSAAHHFAHGISAKIPALPCGSIPIGRRVIVNTHALRLSVFSIACALGFLAPAARALDTDGDGVDDAIDVCCNTPIGVPVDAAGRPLADFDQDCDVDLADYQVFELSFTGPDACTPEVCDGVDNDCNCLVDDMGTLTCGLGDCFSEVDVCVGGELRECVPGEPAPEVCDGRDNDCDGALDDGEDEPWFNQPCDGPDGDLCVEGVYGCSGGVQTCSDQSGTSFELCNGVDDDCNPATPDGADESTLGDPCDGPDADLCLEGTYACMAGQLTCTDQTATNLDLCNGVDDDCNPATPDGMHDPLIGQLCDGPDGDLCEEGSQQCLAGGIECSDNTPTTFDLCDGFDNDCDPSTLDGADEAWLGISCDGPDSDLCAEGTFDCAGGVQSCSDTTGDDLELCNGADDDCNPATQDGEHEAWFGDPCDGPDTDLCLEGQWGCELGAPTCSDTSGDNFEICNGLDDDCDPSSPDGSDEPWYDFPCDGDDSDLCLEGHYQCIAAGQFCTDQTGDDLELCDGFDNDCDPATPDGADDPQFGVPCDGQDTDYCEEGFFTCNGGSFMCDDFSGNDFEMCDDQLDNDCDYLYDCEDPECDGQPCGPLGAICVNNVCSPT
jgi:Notch-like protein